jgi:C_GCAxxG_C_C family probable redox protein
MDVKSVGRRALEYDRNSGCSQSVLLALQEAFDIGDTASFKAATVLSGGVARRGETCGAVLGALMAVGLVVGREDIADTEAYRQAMAPSADLIRAFQERLQAVFGFSRPLETTLCRDIQQRVLGRSFDLNDPTDYAAFLDAGGHGDAACPLVCATAAEVAAEKLPELGR